jgi:hypothetical protein
VDAAPQPLHTEAHHSPWTSLGFPVPVRTPKWPAGRLRHDEVLAVENEMTPRKATRRLGLWGLVTALLAGAMGQSGCTHGPGKEAAND